MLEALITEFEAVEDPRDASKVEHRLIDILVIAVCAVLGQAESFEDMADYGRCKHDWLKRFLALPNGIPSHDTFRRVLMLIDPDRFERVFLGWVRAVFRRRSPSRTGRGRSRSTARPCGTPRPREGLAPAAAGQRLRHRARDHARPGRRAARAGERAAVPACSPGST